MYFWNWYMDMCNFRIFINDNEYVLFFMFDYDA